MSEGAILTQTTHRDALDRANVAGRWFADTLIWAKLR